MNEKYLIVHRTQNAFGGRDIALFWRPESKGYTADIDQAGLYSRDEALGIEKSTHGENVAFLADDLLGKAYRVLELCRLPTVKIGEVYYDPDSHAFVQPRRLDGDFVVCGGYTDYFADAKTNICETRFDKRSFKRMQLVLTPDGFPMAELDATILAWRVKGKRKHVECW